MFFLLRMAFWLGLVLVLLPTDKSSKDAEKSIPQVAASDAILAATAAVSDISQICTRQPTVCAVGGQAATVVGHRAQEGAKKLYHIITEKRASDRTGSIGSIQTARGLNGDTLTADDLELEWQAPVPETRSFVPD